MKFTVVLTPSAEQRLAAIWIASRDRDAVNSTANLIDALLSDDPQTLGVVNFDTVRTLIIEPLGVDFEVVEADRIVQILAIWDIRTSRD